MLPTVLLFGALACEITKVPDGPCKALMTLNDTGYKFLRCFK
jgi:hypothetical protein